MHFIGIDIGTTSISGAVLDLDKGKVENISKIDNDTWIHTGNYWERMQDANIITKKVRTLLDNILSGFKDTKGIGLTGQMHGIIYLDKQGSILSPLYTWQDGRSKLKIKDKLNYVDELIDRTGKKIYAGYGLATHYYNLKNQLVPESAKYISTIADYIAMVLSGRESPVTDSSNALSLGLFDLDNMEFDRAQIDKTGMDTSMLPEVIPSGKEIGKLRGIYPVVCATGDNQASILGSTRNIRKSINVNIGTGGQINIFSEKNVEIDGAETRPYFDSGFIQLGASLCGGKAYAVLEKFFRDTLNYLTGEKTDDLYEKMSEVELSKYAGADRIEVDTRFDGTRNDPFLRGSIRNISSVNLTPEGLILGFQEGIVKELYGHYINIKKHLKIMPESLAAAGNGIRKNGTVRFFLEKMFGLPIRLTEYAEEAAVGAAITAVVGLGYKQDFLDVDELITYR